MSCIITHKGQKYSEEQFKEYFINNKQEFVTSIAKNKDVMDSFKRKMEGIDYVFSQSPELASIGSKTQYLQYLSTIFKTSQVKDIVYHGSYRKFDEFDESKIGTGTTTIEDSRLGKGFYFTKNINEAVNWATDFSAQYEGITAEDLNQEGRLKIAVLDIKNNKDIDGDEIVARKQSQIHILGSQKDVEGFKEFVQGKPIFDKELAQKIQDKLEKLYPEIKLNISNNPVWEQGDNVFNQEGYNNQVNYRLKSVGLLLSDKAVQIFEKGKKANWDLNKILTELQIPKEQRALLLDLGIKDREQLALELASNYSYTVEINTAKTNEEKQVIQRGDNEEFTFNGFIYEYKNGEYLKDDEIIDLIEYESAKHEAFTQPNTQHYSNLSAPGGIGRNKYEDNPDWEYQELEFKTPLITPFIKGHAQFATEHGIGWARVWYNKKTGAVEIQEVQSDLFQKGRDKKELIKRNNDNFIFRNGKPLGYEKNQFLQLLNKDSNWVTFFIKSIIQDSAKKGYEKVLFPKGETAAKIEGHETLAREIAKYDEVINNTEKYMNPDGGYEYRDIFILDENKEEFIKELNKEKSELKSQGIEKLKPIEAFYEIKVGNILEKQFGKDNVKTITDEYGNQWREITINQARDLQNILLQKDEANQIIGQANIKAMTVLIDAVNQKQDTLPHEYAHHYIAWFRNTPIVQEGIKKWGSEEALVQSIGEQVVKQKGEAYNWWNNFVKWIMNQFNSLSKLQKEELTQILTDAFLTRQDLGSKQNIQGESEGGLFLSPSSLPLSQREVLPLTEETRGLYKQKNLLNKYGNVKIFKGGEIEARGVAESFNRTIGMDFDARKTPVGWKVFILKDEIKPLSPPNFKKVDSMEKLEEVLAYRDGVDSEGDVRFWDDLTTEEKIQNIQGFC